MMYVKEYRRWRPVKQSRRPLLDSSTTLVTFDMHYVQESEDVMFVFVLSLFVLKIRLGTHLVQHPIFNALYLLAYNDLHPVSTNMVLYEEETDCNLIGVLENIQSLSIILQRYKMRKKDLKNKFIPLLYISSTCEAFTALSQRSTAQGAWTDNWQLCVLRDLVKTSGTCLHYIKDISKASVTLGLIRSKITSMTLHLITWDFSTYS